MIGTYIESKASAFAEEILALILRQKGLDYYSVCEALDIARQNLGHRVVIGRSDGPQKEG